MRHMVGLAEKVSGHKTIAPRFYVALDRGYVPGLKTLFTFGAFANARILVIGYHPEDALEIAAEVLRKVAPGMFDDDVEVNEEEEPDDRLYTESGYLVSSEIHAEWNASRAHIKTEVERATR